MKTNLNIILILAMHTLSYTNSRDTKLALNENEEDLKNQGNPKRKATLKMKTTSKIKTTSKMKMT